MNAEKRQLYCAPAYCGLVPKMEKLGVRSSKCRHQSSSQTDVSLSVVVAVKLVIQCDVVQLRKKKKKLAFVCLAFVLEIRNSPGLFVFSWRITCQISVQHCGNRAHCS